jgi:hypothetical protein
MLRSLEKNVKCDFTVIIATETLPPWLKRVAHFYVEERFYPRWLEEMNDGVKHCENYFDTLDKLCSFVNSYYCPKEFVYVTDDVLLLKEIHSIDDIHNYPLAKETNETMKKRSTIKHGKTIVKAVELSGNDEPFNYDTHFPRRYNKFKLQDMFIRHNYRHIEVPYSFATLYGNLHPTIPPLSEKNNYGAGFWNWNIGATASYPATDRTKIESAVSDKVWMNYNDRSLNQEGKEGRQHLKEFIMDSFSKPSKFEKS